MTVEDHQLHPTILFTALSEATDPRTISSEPTPDIFEHFLLGLVWETKVDTESRVDVSCELPLFCQFGRVVVQNLHVSIVQLDNLLVGLYSFRGD